MWGQLEGETLAHHHDAGFGCVVGAGAGQGRVGVNAGDVDDAAAAGGLREHLPADLLCQKEDRAQVHTDDLFPVLGGRFQERFGKVDASVVHKAIDPAKCGDGFLHQIRLGAVIAHIAMNGQGIPGQAAGNGASSLRADVGHHHVGAFAAADRGDAGAQTPAGAGHNDGFSCQ